MNSEKPNNSNNNKMVTDYLRLFRSHHEENSFQQSENKSNFFLLEAIWTPDNRVDAHAMSKRKLCEAQLSFSN